MKLTDIRFKISSLERGEDGEGWGTAWVSATVEGGPDGGKRFSVRVMQDGKPIGRYIHLSGKSPHSRSASATFGKKFIELTQAAITPEIVEAERNRLRAEEDKRLTDAAAEWIEEKKRRAGVELFAALIKTRQFIWNVDLLAEVDAAILLATNPEKTLDD